MKSTCTARFWKHYHLLPVQARSLADKNYRLWSENPNHPSLHFKPLTDVFWSVRIGIHHRAVGFVEDNEITWVWIGHHSEYDGFIQGLKRR